MKPVDLNQDPRANIINVERRNNFLKFCSLMCILHNKKLNLANIFLLVLQERKIRKLYMQLCDHYTEFEALRSFFEFDSTLHKSKYIKKYLNSPAFKRSNDRVGKKCI